MIKIIMKGWRDGLEKVSLSKLQMNMLEKSLKESKQNVDDLLEGKEVNIEVYDVDIAKKFVEKANSLGAICKIDMHLSN